MALQSSKTIFDIFSTKTPSIQTLIVTIINAIIILVITTTKINCATLEIKLCSYCIDIEWLFLVPFCFYIFSSFKVNFRDLKNIGTISATFFNIVFKVFTKSIILLNAAIYKSFLKFQEGKSILFDRFYLKAELVTSESVFYEYCSDRYQNINSSKKYIPEFKLNGKEDWYNTWLNIGDLKYSQLTKFVDSKVAEYYYYNSTTAIGRFFNSIALFIETSPVLSFITNQKLYILAAISFSLAYRIYNGLGLPGFDSVKKALNLSDTLEQSNNIQIQKLNEANALISNQLMVTLATIRSQIEPLPAFLSEQRALNLVVQNSLESQTYENGTMMYLIKRLFEISTILTYSATSNIELSPDNQFNILILLKTIMSSVFINRNQGDPIDFIDQRQGDNIALLCKALDDLYQQLSENYRHTGVLNVDLLNPANRL